MEWRRVGERMRKRLTNWRMKCWEIAGCLDEGRRSLKWKKIVRLPEENRQSPKPNCNNGSGSCLDFKILFINLAQTWLYGFQDFNH